MSGQVKWQGKKDKFQAVSTCVGLKYPYKVWVKMIKSNNLTPYNSKFQRNGNPDKDAASWAKPMDPVHLQCDVHNDQVEAGYAHLAK